LTITVEIDQGKVLQPCDILYGPSKLLDIFDKLDA